MKLPRPALVPFAVVFSFLCALSHAQVLRRALPPTERVNNADAAIIHAWQGGEAQTAEFAIVPARPDSAPPGWAAKAGNSFQWSLDPDRIVISPGDSDGACAFMRTYRVERESRNSDVTHPAGYTTCVSMSKFRILVKTARPPENEKGNQ